jgi:hypothetical protein
MALSLAPPAFLSSNLLAVPLAGAGHRSPFTQEDVSGEGRPCAGGLPQAGRKVLTEGD